MRCAGQEVAVKSLARQNRQNKATLSSICAGFRGGGVAGFSLAAIARESCRAFGAATRQRLGSDARVAPAARIRIDAGRHRWMASAGHSYDERLFEMLR